MKNLLAALLLVPTASWAAIGYAKFTPPGSGFSFEYPSDWKRQPGMETVHLRPAGKEGASVRVAIERRPAGKNEAKTAKDYSAELEKLDGLKKIEKREIVEAGGRKSERLTLIETAELKDSYGQKLPGPKKETHVVVPLKKGYLVLRIEGVGAAYDRALPEFDRIVSKLTLEK